MSSGEVTSLDGLVLMVLLVAAGRGAFIGIIRESFSIATVGACFIALRFGNAEAATWLSDLSHGDISPTLAPFLTGAVILLGTAGVVGFLGSTVKRGAQAVGLGWADRLGGGVLGLAEGALVATIVVLGMSMLLGREHNAVRHSHSIEAVDYLQQYVAVEYSDQLRRLPDVAAPLRR
jgi:membrane protein required for colicin V production